MKRVVITGTAGFIGKALKHKLHDLGYDILEINEGILSNTDWEKQLINRLDEFEAEVIFHVGACSDTLETDVNYMMVRNYEFTRILSDYCFAKDLPIIYSSSAANYGINNRYPSNLYGWSKYAAENYVINNGGVALRYFNVYGPGEAHKGRMASVAYQMMENNKNGLAVKLFPGKPQRDFVYIDDVISANLYALEEYENLQFFYYEVGSGTARTFEDVLDILKIDYTYLTEDDVPAGYQMFTQSNPKKWMEGWTPKFDLESGLKDYMAYEQNKGNF